MRKLVALSFVAAVASLLNVGCSAHASVHRTDATRIDSTRQVAYVTSPAK